MNVKRKSMYFFIMLATVLATMLAALSGCDQAQHRQNVRQAEPQAVKEIIRSHSNAGGQIKMDHRMPESLMVGQRVEIVLNFELDAFQHLEVSIKDSEDFQLVSAATMVLQGNDTGRLEMRVNLQPLRAGKSYLKLMAATVDGERFRAYAIPLKVFDENGSLPEPTETPRHRIDMPSTAK
jgi:hypothetical protein